MVSLLQLPGIPKRELKAQRGRLYYRDGNRGNPEKGVERSETMTRVIGAVWWNPEKGVERFRKAVGWMGGKLGNPEKGVESNSRAPPHWG